MPSKRELAFQALAAALAGVAGARVVRDEEEPMTIPAGGQVTIRPGQPVPPAALLSPLTYSHEIEAEMVVQVQHASAATRAASLDALTLAVEAAVIADRTLAGAVDDIRLERDDEETEPVEGGAAIATAVLLATMRYESASELG